MPTGARCDGVSPETPVLAPPGAGRFLESCGLTAVSELAPGKSVKIGKVEIAAVEAEHGHGRALRSRRSEAVGFHLSGSRRVYFAGDTDLFDGMAALDDKLDLGFAPGLGMGPESGLWRVNPERLRGAAARAFAADRRPNPLVLLLSRGPRLPPTPTPQRPALKSSQAGARSWPQKSRFESCSQAKRARLVAGWGGRDLRGGAHRGSNRRPPGPQLGKARADRSEKIADLQDFHPRSTTGWFRSICGECRRCAGITGRNRDFCLYQQGRGLSARSEYNPPAHPAFSRALRRVHPVQFG